MSKILKGYKTWLGIALTLIGTLGIYENLGISQDQLAKLIESLAQFIGLAITIYGNYDSHKRLGDIK